METVYYSLVDRTFRLDTPIALEITQESKDFLVSRPGSIDDWITFEPMDAIPDVPEQAIGFDNRHYLRTAGTDVVYYGTAFGARPYAMSQYGTDQRIRFFYRPNAKELTFKSFCIMNLLGLETLLLRHDALILHASFVRFRGRGILFSAPPGTGKSTQAQLWAEYMDADILNGDRAGIRRAEGQWRAYGLPYAGSSRIYRNESAPIEAIVVLRQGKENRIRSLGAAEALRLLMPEFSVHRWDGDFVSRAVDIALALLREIPVYLLECTPDRRSVDLLRKTIMSEV